VSKHFPNKQQQGFQKYLGCLTASFNLQETILHNVEQGNNVYVSFLDSTKAFDTVWRNGLMLKLYELGIKGKIWSLINDCHQGTSSAIIVNQTQSRWFSVDKGVRQGGVLSTFLYLVFINDLINELESGSHNTGILNVKSSCPSLADDISLIGLSPVGLQSSLDIAYAYSYKWRFSFNASKSCILKFRGKRNKVDTNFVWHLGQALIPCLEVYNHLGIEIHQNFKLSARLHKACEKGRKSFFALSDIGTQFLSPMTISHLYKKNCYAQCSIWL
jgi:hypothetical protein